MEFRKRTNQFLFVFYVISAVLLKKLLKDYFWQEVCKRYAIMNRVEIKF